MGGWGNGHSCENAEASGDATFDEPSIRLVLLDKSLSSFLVVVRWMMFAVDVQCRG